MLKRLISIIKTQIFRRLTILLLLTLIIPYLFTTFFITNSLSSSFLELIYHESQSMLIQHDRYLELIRMGIENDMKELLTDYNLIRLLLELRDAGPNYDKAARNIERRLNSIIRTNQFIKKIIYTSPNTHMIGVPSYAFDRAMPSYIDDRYPYLLEEQDFIWLPPENHKVFNDKSLSIQYVGKFTNPETLAHEGYITFIIPPYVFKESIEKISIGQQGFMAITHTNGSIFALADAHSYIEEVNSILKENSFTIPGNYDLESENYEIKVRVQPETSWILWSFIVKEEVQQQVDALVSGMYLSMLSGIVIIIILSIFLSLLLISPVQRLTDALSEITNGEYNIYLQHKMPMELNEIKNKFNTMASTLDSKEKQITNQIATIEAISIQERNARKEIEKTWDYISSIMNSMNSALIACSPDKTITHLNKHAVNEFGLTAGSTLTANLLHNLFDEKELEKLFTDKKDCFFIAKAGENGRFFDIMVFQIESDHGLGFTIEDVSKRIYLEQMMMSSEKMMNLGSLAAGMAHEINNPLSGIIQNAQVLENRLRKAGKSNKSFQDCIDEKDLLKMTELIIETSRKASEIVHNMLQFSQSNQQVMKELSLSRLLNESLELAEKDFQLQNEFSFPSIALQILKHTDKDFCLCVESEIQQLFLNLMQFHSQRLSNQDVKKLLIEIDDDGEYIVITTNDSAPALQESELEHIFEPFHADEAKDSKRGLGLALSYYIVARRHHGKISIENKNGSTVKIMLPKNSNI